MWTIDYKKQQELQRSHLREEQWQILESENPDWDRWNEIEDKLEEPNTLDQVDE